LTLTEEENETIIESVNLSELASWIWKSRVIDLSSKHSKLTLQCQIKCKLCWNCYFIIFNWKKSLKIPKGQWKYRSKAVMSLAFSSMQRENDRVC
jgi:hypothetical protein